MGMRDYPAIARDYAEKVLSGEIAACRWVKLACERQLRDLRDGVPGYRFDIGFASRPCLFIEYLRHVKGELAGQRIRLEPWQVFILTSVFGWVDDDNKRRFRHVYIEVPRGNGKSAISSGVALYALAADGEGGAECYTFATTREQAKIVFNAAQAMARASKDVSSALGISVQAKTVTVMSTNSVLEPKSSENSSLDGLNTHIAVIDELHAHKTRGLYDVVETSLGKRRQPLMWVITTAGFDSTGICYEVRSTVTRVLDQTFDDDSQFGIIYTIDPDDDWTTEEALQKANPNWGVSVMPAELLRHQEKAINFPSAANNFKTKYLDIWCSASAAWMDMQAWRRCADPNLRIEDFEGRKCIIGLDLGSKSDLTAKVLLFPNVGADGKTEYAMFCDCWLPRHAVETSPNSQYAGWVDEGLLHATEGAMTDLNIIEESVKEDLSRYDVEGVLYDPWQATQMAMSLSNCGAPMVECRMTVQNMSDPMKTLEALVKDGRLKHDGSPVMTWMMSNVVAKLDAKDNIFPRKERYENKIDGPVALIMALNRASSAEEVHKPIDIDAFLSL